MLHTLLANEIFGIELIKSPDFFELLLRFLLNTGVIIIVVRYLYYPKTKRKDYLFTYFLISITVFLLCFLLENVKLELGFALGLFAIFGIIRYRTDPIPIKEMTYLFVVIGISVINALANQKISHAELLLANLIIIFSCFGLERLWFLKHKSRKYINYEKIENIKPENYNWLHNDLENRVGVKIEKIEIGNVDFLRDTAQIIIYYYEQDEDVNEANKNTYI